MMDNSDCSGRVGEFIVVADNSYCRGREGKFLGWDWEGGREGGSKRVRSGEE